MVQTAGLLLPILHFFFSPNSYQFISTANIELEIKQELKFNQLIFVYLAFLYFFTLFVLFIYLFFLTLLSFGFKLKKKKEQKGLKRDNGYRWKAKELEKQW